MNWKWHTKVKFFILFWIFLFHFVAVANRKVTHNDNRDVVLLKKKISVSYQYALLQPFFPCHLFFLHENS